MSQVMQNMHGLLLKSNVYLNVVASGKCKLISLEPTEELLYLKAGTRIIRLVLLTCPQ